MNLIKDHNIVLTGSGLNPLGFQWMLTTTRMVSFGLPLHDTLKYHSGALSIMVQPPKYISRTSVVYLILYICMFSMSQSSSCTGYYFFWGAYLSIINKFPHTLIYFHLTTVLAFPIKFIPPPSIIPVLLAKINHKRLFAFSLCFFWSLLKALCTIWIHLLVYVWLHFKHTDLFSPCTIFIFWSQLRARVGSLWYLLQVCVCILKVCRFDFHLFDTMLIEE